MALLMQLQHLEMLAKSLTTRLEPKNCIVLYLRHNVKIKAPLCDKTKPTIASHPALSSDKLALGGGAKSLASPSKANARSDVMPRSRRYGDVTATYIRRSKIPSRIYAKHQHRKE